MAELASTTVYGDLRITGQTRVSLPTIDEHATTKAYVDAQIVDAKARANHTGTQPLSTITGHDKAVHDALNIDADTVDGSHASTLLSRGNHTGTQPISTLSDHNKANHDSLNIDADTVDGQHASEFAAAGHSHAGGYSAIVGDGVATQIVITHNLGSSDVIVQLSDVTGTSVVEADIQITDNNTVTLDFINPPASNSIRAVILSASEYNASIVVSRARTVLPFGIEGPLTPITGKAQFPVPFNCSIIDVRARVATPPTGDSIVVDVNKNGSTVFTTQANRPTIAPSANDSSTTMPDTTLLVTGDWISVDIDQVGSTTSGEDIVVVVTVREEL